MQKPVHTLSDTVNTSHWGIQKLANFYDFAIQQGRGATVHLDLSRLTFIQANLSALLLGLVLHLRQQYQITVETDTLHLHRDFDVLARNGLTKKGFRDLFVAPNAGESIVPVMEFDMVDPHPDLFGDYILTQFLGHSSMRSVASHHKGRIGQSFSELYSNASEHANTSVAVACGQFFPNRGELLFTFTDIGEGFLPKIQSIQPAFKAHDAITWAVEGNSSRDTLYGPGGSGLRDIREFCGQTGSSLHIISNGCYWAYNGISKRVSTEYLVNAFPGTTINLCLRLSQ